jgi:hypothetical protein
MRYLTNGLRFVIKSIVLGKGIKQKNTNFVDKAAQVISSLEIISVKSEKIQAIERERLWSIFSPAASADSKFISIALCLNEPLKRKIEGACTLLE